MTTAPKRPDEPLAAELNLYTASIPVFRHYLTRLHVLLDMAESQTTSPTTVLDDARRTDAAELLAARLAPDMLPFETQVMIACNFTLRACFPLAGEAIPPYGEFPSTFAGLHARVRRTEELLGGLGPSQFVGREQSILESKAGNALVSLRAPEFLLHYALPNFFFHLTTAYAILRNQGIAVGKEHFDGFHAYGADA